MAYVASTASRDLESLLTGYLNKFDPSNPKAFSAAQRQQPSASSSSDPKEPATNGEIFAKETATDGRLPAVFAYGASGSGKSRLVLHSAFNGAHTLGVTCGYLYQHMCTSMPGMHDVISEAQAKEHKDSDTTTAGKALRDVLLNHNLLEKPDARRLRTMSLGRVMLDWAQDLRQQHKAGSQQEKGDESATGEKGEARVCLIIHLDEAQEAPWKATCIMRAIVDANRDCLLENNVLAVPIVTGLSTRLTQDLMQAISTIDPAIIYVKFFSVTAEGEDLNKITLNAFNALMLRRNPELKAQEQRLEFSQLQLQKKLASLKEQRKGLLEKRDLLIEQQVKLKENSNQRQELDAQLEALLTTLLKHDTEERRVGAQLEDVTGFLFKVQQMQLTIQNLKSIPELHLLVEDTGGWTLGLVRLGVACAAQTYFTPFTPFEWIFSRIEDSVLRDLMPVYGSADDILGRVLNMDHNGLPKLLRLVMSAFKVSSVAC